MGNTNRDNFGYLGLDYQFRLIAQLLTDNKFANSILDIVNPNYFEDEHLRVIASEIKEAYDLDEIVPDVQSLEFRLVDKIKNEVSVGFLKTQLEKIKNANLNDTIKVQKIAMNFCKQQEAKKAIKKVQRIIDTGNLEDYDQIEEIFKKVLEVGDNKDDGIDVFDNLAEVLSDDFRKPIPTGINGLDEKMDGGLSKGELAIILAPFGVGKTTMITKIANTAKDLGYNVLQIFFEDNPKVIQRKHLTCWMKGALTLNELNDHKEEIFELANRKKEEAGILKLKKMASDGTTIPMIKQYIRKQIAQGFRPDIVLIDYIDCVQPTKQFDNEWSGEGNVMRQFETMLSELDLAGWTAVQGNRSSIGAEVVESDQMGGSIKKGQIGHFIVSIAKTLEQKENGTANLAILKSRFGKDGIVFEDCVFDNGRIQIDVTQQTGKSFLETRDIKAQKDQDRVSFVLGALQDAKSEDGQNNND
jgi:replicative DNA helicase